MYPSIRPTDRRGPVLRYAVRLWYAARWNRQAKRACLTRCSFNSFSFPQKASSILVSTSVAAGGSAAAAVTAAETLNPKWLRVVIPLGLAVFPRILCLHFRSFCAFPCSRAVALPPLPLLFRHILFSSFYSTEPISPRENMLIASYFRFRELCSVVRPTNHPASLLTCKLRPSPCFFSMLRRRWRDRAARSKTRSRLLFFPQGGGYDYVPSLFSPRPPSPVPRLARMKCLQCEDQARRMLPRQRLWREIRRGFAAAACVLAGGGRLQPKLK